MIKFCYSVFAWLLTHYDELPIDFTSKFPKEIIRDFTLIVSNFDINSKLFKGYD